VGLYSRTIIVTRTPEARITIGNHVGISGATIYARKGISIGDNTLIGGNVKILDNDFHPVDVEARLVDNRSLIGTRPIIIGKNCFIGCNSIILKGTVLGDGCVIGAGAVVSGKFEGNSVIAGNPARVIKKLKQSTLDQ
jgi:acetyltransferase-like isoleucine patch superfamily enzyme